MYRVLLVDDDMIVRMYLTGIVQWEQHGLKICGTARDGGEALELCKTEHPDLVLTDISMPQIDGIELIRRLRNGGYDGTIIALSCHDDFELVKNAMHEGADDYLLKNHLDENSIGATLDTIREKINLQSTRREQKRLMESFVQRGLDSAKRELMKDILSGKMPEADLAKRIRTAGLHGRYLRLAVFFIRPIQADREQTAILFSLYEQRLRNDAELLKLNDSILTLLVDLTDMPSQMEISHFLTRIQNIVQSISEQYLNLSVGIAGSAVCEGKNAWNDALRQAWDTLQHAFYGGGRWRYGEAPVMADKCPQEMERFVEMLPEFLLKIDEQAIRESWKEALEAARHAWLSPGILLSWLRRCDLAANVARTENQYSEIVSFGQYTDLVEQYIKRGRERGQEEIPDSAGTLVQEAVRYILANYQSPIGLGHAARLIGCTPTYLSARFKKEMGIGFSEYLLDIRLSHVKRGLRSSGLTVKALSEQAGFQDYSYFCKAFKRKTGLTPKEYRQSIQ